MIVPDPVEEVHHPRVEIVASPILPSGVCAAGVCVVASQEDTNFEEEVYMYIPAHIGAERVVRSRTEANAQVEWEVMYGIHIERGYAVVRASHFCKFVPCTGIAGQAWVQFEPFWDQCKLPCRRV